MTGFSQPPSRTSHRHHQSLPLSGPNAKNPRHYEKHEGPGGPSLHRPSSASQKMQATTNHPASPPQPASSLHGHTSKTTDVRQARGLRKNLARTSQEPARAPHPLFPRRTQQWARDKRWIPAHHKGQVSTPLENGSDLRRDATIRQQRGGTGGRRRSQKTGIGSDDQVTLALYI